MGINKQCYVHMCKSYNKQKIIYIYIQYMVKGGGSRHHLYLNAPVKCNSFVMKPREDLIRWRRP